MTHEPAGRGRVSLSKSAEDDDVLGAHGVEVALQAKSSRLCVLHATGHPQILARFPFHDCLTGASASEKIVTALTASHTSTI